MSISSVNGVASTVSRYRFVASGGETSVSGTDANGATISYLAGKEEVYLNGALLVRGQDYTGNDGATISSLTALVAGDTVEIITFVPFAIPTAISSSAITSVGDLLVGTGTASVTRLGVGTSGQVLASTGTTPAYTSTVTSLGLTNPYFTSPKEVTTVSASAPTATFNYDLLTQGIYYSTASTTSNITLNFRGNNSTTANSILNTNDSWTAYYLITNGASAYYPNVIQVDGSTSGVTVKWSGGTAPSAGNASAVDAYSFNIVKTASATYTILAGTSKFA
jgi:hypothetical protein